MCENQGRSKAL